MLEKGIKELLTGDSTVNTMTGGRIRPMIGAQLDIRPFLVFSIAAGEDLGHSTGKSAYEKASVEIGIYGDTYLAVAELSAAVKNVLNRIARTMSTVRIAPIVFDDQTEPEEVTPPGQSAPVFVRTQTYRACYRNL